MRRRSLLTCAALSTLAGSSIGQVAFPSNAERIIGLSLPLSGAQAEVGKDLEQGYRLGLKAAGANYDLLVLDDGGEVLRAVENTKAFIKNKNVIAMSCLVGTAHAQAVIPITEAAGLPMLGLRSGSRSLRKGVYNVFHLRSSYEEEQEIIAQMCGGGLIKRIGIIYSDDPFGKEAYPFMEAALAAKGIKVLPPMPANRDGSNIKQVSKAFANMLYDNPANEYTGVILLLVSKPMQDAVRELKEVHRLVGPMFAMSFTATKSVTSEVIPHLAGLGLVTAFPIPTTSNTRLVQAYKRDCEAFKAPELMGTLTGFEGWFYASVMARTGAQTRAQVIQRMNAGVQFSDLTIKPDAYKVCFKHLQIAMKQSDGKLRG